MDPWTCPNFVRGLKNQWGPLVDPCGPLVALCGPLWTLCGAHVGPCGPLSKIPTKVKPRFGDFGKKKSISLHGRPKVVAKPADSQEFLYNMVLRTWIWSPQVLVHRYLARCEDKDLDFPTWTPNWDAKFRVLDLAKIQSGICPRLDFPH